MADRGLIHVVDDSTSFRRSLRLMLEICGFTVREYDNGRVFFDAVIEEPTGAALVDINMPEMDGLELLEGMNQRGIRVPVIIMTGDADVRKAVRAMKANAVEFIEKPFVLNVLLEAIKAAQAHRPALPQGDSPELTAFRARLSDLTLREHEILEMVVAGFATKAIAHRLAISSRTVDAHRASIRDKLGVVGVSNLVRLAIAAGFAGTATISPALGRNT